MSIGGIYYYEALYDSAWCFLKTVFDESPNINSKKLAAEWMIEICKTQGKDSETTEYAVFLAPFATQDENKGADRSRLAELYHMHKRLETEHLHQQKTWKQTWRVFIVILGLLILMFVFFVLYRKNKKRKHSLEVQIRKEQYAHEIKQKALSGRLKRSNAALRRQNNKTRNLTKQTDARYRKTKWSNLDEFMKEEICQEIMTTLSDKHIKREAKRDDYPDMHLSDAQLHSLSCAVDKHFCGFEKSITDLYPKISRNALNQCLLYLLNIEDVQIAALLSCDYSTIKRRSSKLKATFNTEKEVRQFIRELIS